MEGGNPFLSQTFKSKNKMKAQIVKNNHHYGKMILPAEIQSVTLVNGKTYPVTKNISLSGKHWSWNFRLDKEDEKEILGFTLNKNSQMAFSIYQTGELNRVRIYLTGGNSKSYHSYPNPLDVIAEIN